MVTLSVSNIAPTTHEFVVVRTDLPDGERRGALVRAIVEPARTLRLSTVAEGVESAEQVTALRRANCGWAQDYLFGGRSPRPSSRRCSLLS